MRGKRERRRLAIVGGVAEPEPMTETDHERWRGRVAWHMTVDDCQLGTLIGFTYPIDGDARP